MKIVMIDTDGNFFTAYNVSELSYTDSVDAACASLSFTCKISEPIGEIAYVKAYAKNDIFFNGLCDCQRVSADENGLELFIWARSSACLLIDNQARPFTFNSPSARQLWAQYARDKGIDFGVGDICAQGKYEVSGASCFGAINDFVKAYKGVGVYVDEHNILRLRSVSEEEKSLSSLNVISERFVINRSEPISQISYKRAGESDYRRHMLSTLARDKDIRSQVFLNLSSLPEKQQEHNIEERLQASFDSYRLLELTVVGGVDAHLGDRCRYSGKTQSYDGYILTQIKYTLGENGERTRLTLRKDINPGGMIYVD